MRTSTDIKVRRILTIEFPGTVNAYPYLVIKYKHARILGETMDIYARLKKDHDKQRDLANNILNTSGDSKERQKLFADFKKELDAHALAEEQVFYAELMEDPEATETARHSVTEHKEASDLLEELSELDMSSGGWIQKFAKLQEMVEHHVDEEENEVFPLSSDLIEPARAEKMADEFDTRKEEEIA